MIVEENEPESSEKSANESQDEAEEAKNLEVILENIREKMESMASVQVSRFFLQFPMGS